MAMQLTFDLPVRVSRGRGDFFVSAANELAVARLDDTAGWTRGKLALTGPEGAGKSHLAHVWAEAEGAVVTDLDALPALDLAGIATPMAVELPEADAFAPATEETLFHLHNHMATAGLPLLLIARTAPARWPVALPDLKSRMQATDVVRIEEPDDALLTAVLVKLFADRQLQVPPGVIGWLATRMERSFAQTQRLVAALDETALAERRGITRTLAQQVLDKLYEEAQQVSFSRHNSTPNRQS